MVRTALESEKTDTPFVIGYGDEVDVHVLAVPVAFDAMAQSEIANAPAASFFVQLTRDLFERIAFRRCKLGVSLYDQFWQRPKMHRGDGPLQGSEPGAQEVVTDIIAPGARLRFGKDRQLALDHPITLNEGFEIAAYLATFVTGYAGDGVLNIGVAAPRMPGHVLQHSVVTAAQLAQEPVVCFGLEWG